MSTTKKLGASLLVTGLILKLFLPTSACWGSSPVKLSKGQTLYVPVYSHVFFGDRARTYLLTINLNIRNTDLNQPITVLSVDYHDTEGRLIKKFVQEPVKLPTLASTWYVVKESDTSGGSGAKFIVRWKSETPVTQPIMEGVMISTKSQQGISFSFRGEVIEEDPR